MNIKQKENVLIVLEVELRLRTTYKIVTPDNIDKL